MPAIVDFPTIVKEALALFGDLFATESARRHSFPHRHRLRHRYLRPF